MFDRMSLGGGVSSALRSSALVLVMLGSSATASAQDFGLPIQVLQGAAFDAGPVTPYQIDFAAIPSLEWEKFRVGAKLGRSYDNPEWNWRAGGRLGVQIKGVEPTGLRGIGLWLEGEATTTADGDWRYGAGLTFDVDGLISVGAWGGYDHMHDGGWFGLSFGADPTSWSGCIKDDFTGECR